MTIPDGRIVNVGIEGVMCGGTTGVVGAVGGEIGGGITGVLVLLGQKVVVNVVTSVVEPITTVDVPVDVVVVEPERKEVADGFGIGVQFGRVKVPLKFPEPP